ncbi:mitochondrial metallochaperone Sco1 [Acrasis kona]|uniref:Mitochondrial metallochaperone Sco1 n=1 Tax=Acrasis kona TaxID=1008807 RepID=A0AAW2YTP3_9EUKA
MNFVTAAVPVILLAISGVYYYLDLSFRKRNREIQQKILGSKNDRPTSNKIAGGIQLGGPFTLVDTQGKVVEDTDFRGKWMFVYFGFTHCPDICPTEMRKMKAALRLLNNTHPDIASRIVPIFITVDPTRDSCERIAEYFKQDGFESFVGLTGTTEQIKNASKQYRVFYSAPDAAEKENKDYNIDHSVFIYLQDPEGNFSQYFSSNQTSAKVSELLKGSVEQYDQERLLEKEGNETETK